VIDLSVVLGVTLPAAFAYVARALIEFRTEAARSALADHARQLDAANEAFAHITGQATKLAAELDALTAQTKKNTEQISLINQRR
jgi:hypothetical protein